MDQVLYLWYPRLQLALRVLKGPVFSVVLYRTEQVTLWAMLSNLLISAIVMFVQAYVTPY